MAEIIASTYELIEKIGAGGGGVVYLARHLRLEKLVVLKADKRKITTDPALLRREIDVLKDLSHPYIPQVYDFFVEGDTVYSVIEFVEGESLDKPLAQGTRFPQHQVIRWARQLLEAVVYLHSPIHGEPPRGYVHADIKPANIMCRPNGDICLIDFNIALAIGEENVVGASAGYASPEHYGLDYSSRGLGTRPEPTPMPGDLTAKLPQTDEKQSVVSQRRIVPDERSDIYSIGATLYHLFSGRKPPKDAFAVEPLTEEEASHQICEIIAKSMAPDPDMRYQTAEAMLDAFRRLYENDPRTLQRKRRIRTAIITVSAVFLLGVGTAFAGLRIEEQEQRQAKMAAEAAEETQRAARILAEQNEEQERLAKEKEQTEKQALQLVKDAQERITGGDNNGAIALAINALELATRYDAQAQKVLTDALGVYDLSETFQPQQTVQLPASPFKTALSPNGRYLAAVYPWETAIYDTDSGTLLFKRATPRTATTDALFAGDDLFFCAAENGLEAIDIATGNTRWSGGKAARLAVSDDGKRVAAVFREEEHADIYDTESGELVSTVSFEGRKQLVNADEIYIDRRDSLLALNRDGSALAVSFSDGTLAIFDTESGTVTEDLLPASGYTHFEGGFYEKYFVFCADGAGEKPLFAQVNLVDSTKDLAMYLPSPFLLQVDHRGVYIASGNTLVRFDPDTQEQTEVAYTTDLDIGAFCCVEEFAVVTAGNRVLFFDRGANRISEAEGGEPFDFPTFGGGTTTVASRNTPFIRVLSLRDHSDSEVFSYDPAYIHREARLNADSTTVMLFRRGDFRLYSMDGRLITEQTIPNEDQVYDQQYRRDAEGSRLEVIYRDGTIRSYSAVDGKALPEKKIDPPETNLEEDFETDAYRIHTVPHEAPKVYDKATGQYLRDLETDDDLTYVTQVGEYIITEYISTQGDRYGLLLNADCETLACLPRLCDILNGELLFDYPSGHIRRSPIYSAEELIGLGQARIS